jgi:hypothetical protein
MIHMAWHVIVMARGGTGASGAGHAVALELQLSLSAGGIEEHQKGSLEMLRGGVSCVRDIARAATAVLAADVRR